jgi:hypothetical protein
MSGGPTLPPLKNRPLNKSPNSSNRTRTLDSSTCTGSLSIPSSSSDKTAQGAPNLAPRPEPLPLALLLHGFPPPAPAQVRPSAQHTLTSTLAQVENRLPLHLFSPSRIFLPWIRILFYFHRPFCARMRVHWKGVVHLAMDAALGLPPGGSRCIGPIPVPWQTLVRSWTLSP